jgi:hypothetical protein
MAISHLPELKRRCSPIQPASALMEEADVQGGKSCDQVQDVVARVDMHQAQEQSVVMPKRARRKVQRGNEAE